MKKIFSFLILSLIFISCSYTSEDQKKLNQECISLRKEKSALQNQINSSYTRLGELKNEVNELVRQRNLYQSGKEIKYIVKFKIIQGTFTIDIFEHVKNEMNSIEIEIPVNKEFYDRLSIGQDITDSFKWGSLVMDGDFSSLHMKVIGKRIE